MLNDPYYKRSYVVGAIAVVIVLIYIIRLFILQVVDHTTGQLADKNALLRQTVYPSRGLIYDRNDTLLVYNQPIYEVMLINREIRNDFDTLAFCATLKMTEEEFADRMKQMKNARGYSGYTPQVFLSQLTMEDVSPLQQMLFHFPGVSIRKRTLRDYRYNLAAHLLGSVGEVNQRDLDNDSYYQAGDYSGRDGIERRYEKLLRGEKGVEILMRDYRGRIQGAYHNGEDDQLPVSGKNLHLSIDIRLQQLAEELMHGKMGSVVALEPATGEVLALVSMPAWDPKTLVGRQRSANYNALLHDKYKPLMNRATQAEYPPGSTFKLLQALVGLQEKSISPRSRVATPISIVPSVTCCRNREPHPMPSIRCSTAGGRILPALASPLSSKIATSATSAPVVFRPPNSMTASTARRAGKPLQFVRLVSDRARFSSRRCNSPTRLLASPMEAGTTRRTCCITIPQLVRNIIPVSIPAGSPLSRTACILSRTACIAS